MEGAGFYDLDACPSGHYQEFVELLLILGLKLRVPKRYLQNPQDIVFQVQLRCTFKILLILNRIEFNATLLACREQGSMLDVLAL